MKKILIPLILLIILPFAFATNLQIEKESSGEVLIVGVDQPVVFDLKIKNLESTDDFEFYNFLGFNMFPKGTIHLQQGKTEDVELKLSPIGEIKNRGYYTLEYYIKGEVSPEIKKELTFKIIELGEAFRVGSTEMNPASNSIDIYIKNRENFNFKKLNVKFSSSFFELEREISLAPYEEKTFTVELNKEDFKKLMAGFYTLKAEIETEGKKAEIEGVIKFGEKDIIVTTKKDYGFFIQTNILRKANEGNVVANAETLIKKNIISRLFTTISPEPDIVERDGTTVYYMWNRQIKPGETFEITTKTNWLFPLIAVLFIVAVVILAKKSSGTNVVLRKKISFVRAKGGEFALKVSIFVHAKKYIEKVNIIDNLPPLVKLHESFGIEKPTRVNERIGKLEWNFNRLEPGESRILSYLIYSRIGVLGRFSLPSAIAIFERDGKIKEAESNQAFFVAEQKFRKGGEE